MTTFTSSRRKMARRFIRESFDSSMTTTTTVITRESTDKYQPSSTYGRLLDINEQQDGTCLKNGSTTLIIISILDMHYLIRSFLKRRKL